MKTKIIASLLVLCMTAWFSSCDLDSKVYSSFSETNFPKTEEDARSMLTGLYAYFKRNSGMIIAMVLGFGRSSRLVMVGGLDYQR